MYFSKSRPEMPRTSDQKLISLHQNKFAIAKYKCCHQSPVTQYTAVHERIISRVVGLICSEKVRNGL